MSIFQITKTNIISLLTYFIIFSFSKYDYKTVLLIQGVSIISTMFDISWFYYGTEIQALGKF